MILITGGAGHLGNVLARELCAEGKDVRVLVLPGEDCKSLKDLPVDCVEGNILDPESLRPALRGVDQVFHLAALVSITSSQEDLLYRINVQGTKNMLEAAQEAGVKRFIYTSSIHALSRPPEGTVIDERLPFDTNNIAGAYDRTKAEASLIVQSFARSGMEALIVCPTGVIGPYDYRRSEMGEMILEWMEKRPSFIIEGAFDFVDVRDVARGHILALEKGIPGETYILGGERISVTRLRRLVKETTQTFTPEICIPIPLARAAAVLAELYYRLTRSRPRFTRYSIETLLSNSQISSEKARMHLGYVPRKMEDTVRDTVAWWRQNHSHIQPSLRIES